MAKPLAVPLWPRPTSISYIREALPSASERDADRLAALLGDLPLALAQAVGYIDQSLISIPTYCNLFGRHQSVMLAKGSPADREQSTIATIWEVALERLTQEAPDAIAVLTLAAHLAPDQIPLDLLQTFLEEAAKEAAEPAELRLPEAMGALNRYALISRGEQSISLHRLVQAVVSGRLSADEQAGWRERAMALLLAAWPKKVDEVTTWPRAAALLPHALAAAEQGKEQAPGLAADLLSWVGVYLINIGQYGEARSQLERALAATQAAVQGPAAEVAVLRQLITACKFGGDFGAAYAHAQAALRIAEQAGEPDDLRIAQARVALADGAVRMGEWAVARQQAQAAKERLLRLTLAEEEQADVDLHNLAWVHNSLGEHEGALELCLRSLQIKERRQTKVHPETIVTMMNVGDTLRRLGRFTEARPYLERSLALSQEIFPADHPRVATAHHCLAHLLADAGEREAARSVSPK